MMGRPIDELVYHQLFPRPKVSDPPNFQAFLQRLLLPEVREETHSFYGHIKTPEARYPGLDYAHHTHRLRLSRWPWHRRLFRAFDGLALTRAEIAALTRWEGTRWAKEKYEKEQGVAIRDTAADICPTWEHVLRHHHHHHHHHRRRRAVAAHAPAAATSTASSSSPSPSLSLSSSPVSRGISTPPYQPADDNDDDEENDDGQEDNNNDDNECEDEISGSVGVELNARLRSQAALRDAGDASAVLDEAWEEWFKTALESGELAVVTEDMVASTTSALRRQRRSARRGSHPSSSSSSLLPSAIVPAALIPSSMMDLARGGQWADIPEPLHHILRDIVDREAAAIDPAAVSSSSSAAAANNNNNPDLDLAATPRALRQQLAAATPRSAMGFNFFGTHLPNPAAEPPVTRTTDTYYA